MLFSIDSRGYISRDRRGVCRLFCFNTLVEPLHASWNLITRISTRISKLRKDVKEVWNAHVTTIKLTTSMLGGIPDRGTGNVDSPTPLLIDGALVDEDATFCEDVALGRSRTLDWPPADGSCG